MKISFDDIESAYFFANAGPIGANEAYISKKTGKIFYISEYGDDDDDDELPDDDDSYIEIPGKNELDLGQTLIFEFVSKYLSEEEDRVYNIFRHRGAYSKYKDLLDQKGLLDDWHKFENKRQTDALRQWCSENNIELID